MTYTALSGGIPRTAVVSASTTHIALMGLEEYTNYSILVFASTVKGDGNASDPIIVTTDEDSKFAKAFLGKTFFSGHKFVKFGDRDGTVCVNKSHNCSWCDFLKVFLSSVT